MLPRRSCALATTALLAFTAVACGEPGRGVANRDLAKAKPLESINPTVNPRQSDSPSPGPSASASDAPSASPSATGGGGGGNTIEATPANLFTPAQLKVKVGTKVTWTNPASGFHTVTGGTPAAKDTSKINAAAPFTTLSVTFDKAGTYKYYCEPHQPTMAGEIVVE